MTFSSLSISVMIASPSDVVQERALAREVIHEWNAMHARDRSQVLLPIGWESNSIPAMGERPQEIINKQILKDADILVAIFWTRLGTSTGKAASGTVEEIEEHIATGKPVLIYFSITPVTPASVDTDQYAALTEFRRSLQSRGLYQEFDDAADFRVKFARHLAQTINTRFKGDGLSGDRGKVEVPIVSSPVNLSNEAAELLSEAAKDRTGRIMVLRHMGGTLVQTNGKSFATEGDPRSEAIWEGAVSELEAEYLIEARSYKREVFAITSRGYQVADGLAN